MQETRVRFLAWEEPLEKEMATHSSILAWRIPWTEEPCWLQSMGSQRVGHDWESSLHFTSLHWQPGFWCQSHFPLACPFFRAPSTVPRSCPLVLISWWMTLAHSFVHLPYLISSESSEASVLCGLLWEFGPLELDWFEFPLVVFTHSYWVSHVLLLSTCFCEHLCVLSLCFLCGLTHLQLHVWCSCLRSCSCTCKGIHSPFWTYASSLHWHLILSHPKCPSFPETHFRVTFVSQAWLKYFWTPWGLKPGLLVLYQEPAFACWTPSSVTTHSESGPAWLWRGVSVHTLSCVQLFCDPVDCSLPGSFVYGIFQARILEWVAIPSSRASS